MGVANFNSIALEWKAAIREYHLLKRRSHHLNLEP